MAKIISVFAKGVRKDMTEEEFIRYAQGVEKEIAKGGKEIKVKGK